MENYELELAKARKEYAQAVNEFNKVWFATLSNSEQELMLPYLSKMMSALVLQAKLEQAVFPQAFLGHGIGHE